MGRRPQLSSRNHGHRLTVGVLSVLGVGLVVFPSLGHAASGVPKDHLRSADKRPAIKAVEFKPDGRRGATMIATVRYPPGFWDWHRASLSAIVWPNNEAGTGRPIGTVRKRVVAVGHARRMVDRERLFIRGRTGRFLHSAMKRTGPQARVTVTVDDARDLDSDPELDANVSASEAVSPRSRGASRDRAQSKGAARSGGPFDPWKTKDYTIYNATADSKTGGRILRLDTVPAYCMWDNGYQDSNPARLRGYELRPGESVTVRTRAATEDSTGDSVPNPARLRGQVFSPHLRSFINAVSATNFVSQAKWLPFGSFITGIPPGPTACASSSAPGMFALAAEISWRSYDPAPPRWDGLGVTHDAVALSGTSDSSRQPFQLFYHSPDEPAILMDVNAGSGAITVRSTFPPASVGDPFAGRDACVKLPASWMRCLAAKQVKGELASWDDRTLAQVTLPGAHNAGSAALSDRYTAHSRASTDHCGVPLTVANNSAARAWAITQWDNLSVLLDHGVRFLDLRWSYNPRYTTGWRFTHGALSQNTMGEDLNEILDWLKRHPSEFVVIRNDLCFQSHTDAKFSDQLADLQDIFRMRPGDSGGVCGASVRPYDRGFGKLPVKAATGHLVVTYRSFTAEKDFAFPDEFQDRARACGFHLGDDQTDVADKHYPPSGPLKCTSNWDKDGYVNVFRRAGSEGFRQTDAYFGDRLHDTQLLWDNPIASDFTILANWTLDICPQTLLRYSTYFEAPSLMRKLPETMNIVTGDGVTQDFSAPLIDYNEDKVEGSH